MNQPDLDARTKFLCVLARLGFTERRSVQLHEEIDPAICGKIGDCFGGETRPAKKLVLEYLADQKTTTDETDETDGGGDA